MSEEATKTRRKTIKQVDIEQDLTEAALVDMFEMIVYLNRNRNWIVDDYIKEPPFLGSALAQIVAKAAK